jgi:exosortase
MSIQTPTGELAPVSEEKPAALVPPAQSAGDVAQTKFDWPVIWTALLLAIAFWPILTAMAGSWFDPRVDMEHGIIVPFAAAYMAWTKRESLARIPAKPARWALLIVGWGAMQAIIGTLAQWVWVSRMAFLISLVGSLLALKGARVVRELAYPLFTLTLMVAPPTFVYERITLPLQLLASRLAEVSLEALGYSVLRTGNVLEMAGIKMSVEEACSGIRALIALYFMCVLYNFFVVPEKWIRVALMIGVAPVAILGNTLRIVATGVASRYDPSLMHGGVHDTFGYVSVILASCLCVLLHQAILKSVGMWKSLHG